MSLAMIRTFRWSFILCCLGVLFADWLFYGKPSGINVALFHLFVLTLTWAVVPSCNDRRHCLPLRVLLIGLLLAQAAQPGPLVVALYWLGLLAFLFTARQRWSTNTVEWLARWLYFAFTFLFRFPRDLLILKRWRSSGHAQNRFQHAGREAVKWILPFAGSLLFAALFLLANPVLSYWAGLVESSFQDIFLRFTPTPGRMIFWGIVGASLWGIFRIRYGRKTFPEIGPGRNLPLSVLARCLALFNLVFAVQTILDCIYLWGGATLPAGMTYAQYAHRGAYPLIATALLAGGFVLLTVRAGVPTHQTTLVRRLVYVWLAQNVLLTANSLWRLHLYVQVYSLTRLRLAAAIWMLLVSAGIVLILWRIYAGKSNAWLLNANFVTLVGVLYLCCFVNFNGIISRYNVQNCREITGTGASLDVKYLETLGIESIPALLWFEKSVSGSSKKAEAQNAVSHLIHQLHISPSNWRAWTIRNSELRREVFDLVSNDVSGKPKGHAAVSVLQIRNCCR